MTATVQLSKPVLKLGANGAAVTELQTLLTKYAQFINAFSIAPSVIDGEYGTETQRCVMAFQEQVFLPPTGVAADLTWRSLFLRGPVDLPDVKFGESSEFVTILELRLVRLGYMAGPADKLYNNRTLNAVSAFQRSAGIPQKSTVNAAMWFALSKVAIV
jgi:peptidoglycan hydrolase-like protein with peptidoglycan-binding domain